jgi:hypothetical protein
VTERALLVVRLLRARWDYVPGLRTATGMIVASSSVRGEVRSRWVECRSCGGKGRMGQGRGERQCLSCFGHGRVQVDPMVDREKSKGAIERERVTGEAESVRLRRRWLNGQIRRLEIEALHRAGLVAADEREEWERLDAEMRRDGSFDELDRALLLLERVDAYSRAAVEVVYGYDSPLRLVGKDLQAAADRGVERVAGWMPDPIRVPERAEGSAVRGRWANASARSVRDREIWRLHEVDGLNREQIARRLGIDRSTVSRVLASKVAA